MGKLIDDTGLGDKACVVQATEGAHSQTAVLDFAELILLEDGRVLAKSKGVKGEVTGSTGAVQCSLEGNRAENLKEGNEEEDLRHASGLDEEVMCFGRVHGLDTREADNLREHDTENAKHRNTA